MIYQDLNVRASMTYTKAEITSGTDKGNEPKKTTKLMYGVMQRLEFIRKIQELSFIGQTKAFAQDSNQLVKWFCGCKWFC
jgi:hypothetical protein